MTKERLTGKQIINGAFIALILMISLSVVWDLSTSFRVATVIFLCLTLFYRAWDVLPCALLFFFLFGLGAFFPTVVWQVPGGGFLLAIFLTFLCLLPTRHFPSAFSWLRKGELDQTTLALVVLVSLLSAVALGLWAMWADYLGIGSLMMKSARTTPTWFLLLVGIPGFALVNAFTEEMVYRGILQESLRRRFPNIILVLVLQASAFAAAHYFSGFPNGKLGYLMTFTYAMALGYLRERAEGMLAPWLAHFMADLVIGLLLFLLAY